MSEKWGAAEERLDAAADRITDAAERGEDKLNAAIESLDPRFDAAEEVAASRAALDWAAAELEAGGGTVAAAVAKARSADAAGRVAAVVHQVHGAIGFTAEHALHRSSRVLWRWRERWGDEHDWNAVLGGLALSGGPDALFDLLDGRTDRAGLRPTT